MQCFTSNGGFVRGFRVRAPFGKGAVSVLAKTMPTIDRSADTCLNAVYLVPQLQTNAASATLQTPMSGKHLHCELLNLFRSGRFCLSPSAERKRKSGL